ncbi:MAG: hypothetical protein HZB33_05850 [Nitrospirae bacterium]|nr:hypothetical protein [Nitrospirota bacterium]
MIKLTMHDLFDSIIMTVNYSHDIATAMLAVSALTMWVLSGQYPASSDAKFELFYVKIYKTVTRVAKDSLYWILLAGVPRIIYYKEFEWSDMAGDLQIVAIVIKHVAMFTLVGAGTYFWSRLAKKVRTLKLKHNLG